MYIAHYKSVNSSKEFYSKTKDNLNFPTQVEMGGERYMLNATYVASAPSIQKRIEDRAKQLNIPYDVEIK